ncbi:hypothetical protein Acy02nite_23700 [Actinoplanes cyaneus]|uniref:Uncharacterized protein n=1 Tax=Actinoplanes cyaneus TaxID=52696 RepID=A0A919M6K4_9ACTN|nr:hypothetical protein [Actinoplanes cyaneus]GID64489.1 hypothetical protein Acy02nite_23700 [Actinoplanes cyaneus]
MRFFSNEAKDNTEDQDQDVRTEAVPQQRPGSPWDDRPGANAEHDPAPQPTAFGAATPGGAVAASAMAGPYDDVDHDTHRSTDAASGVADDRTVAPGDGVIDEDADRDRANDDTVAWPAGQAPVDRDNDDRDPLVDVPLDDHPEDGVDEGRDTAGESHVAGHRATDDIDAGRPGNDGLDSDRLDNDGLRNDRDEDRADGDRIDDAEVDAALEDRGTFEDPQVTDGDKPGTAGHAEALEPVVAEPVVVAPVAVTEQERAREAEAEPVVAVAAVPEPVTTAAAGPATTAGGAGSATTAGGAGSATLFPDAETQPLRDRWRDIQLRFVDDPKASTAEAASLVDETIEKLTTALREHRGSLAGGGDDTEALRVELRSYRDILDRLLGL